MNEPPRPPQDPPPAQRPEEPFAGRDVDAIYDVFDDAVASLQAACVSAIANAVSDAERQLWIERTIALRHYRLAVDPEDRAAVISGLLLMQDELRLLSDRAARHPR